MRYLRITTWALLSLVLFAPLLAVTQYNVCTELVQTALAATDDLCVDTRRNSACYGHVQLDAEPQAGFAPFKFDEVGDMVSVAHLNTLRLSPMDMEEGTWGVALLRLQADIPDEKPQNVNLLLFGDVEVQNMAPAPILIDLVMNSSGNVNVRREPERSAFVMTTLTRGQTVTARGRSEDNEWIYVDLPEEEDRQGWVLRRLVRSDEDLDTLNVIQPNLTEYGPMQAFYLKTGSNQSTCEEAPSDGLLVQTPEGIAEVRLWINEVKIRLGSTAFIQSGPGNQMNIKTLEGTAEVSAFGVEVEVPAGSQTTLPVDSRSGAVVSPPSKAEPIAVEEVADLPVDILDRPLEVDVETTGTVVFTEIAATEEPSATNTPTEVPTQPPPTPTDTEAPTVEASLTPTDEPAPTNTDIPPTDTDVPPSPIPPTETPTDDSSGQTRSDPPTPTADGGSSQGASGTPNETETP